MSVKVTDEGKSLLENAVLQGDKVVFSQMELIADTEKSPTEMIKRVDVSSISAADNHTIVVKAQVDNAGFSDTYYFSRVNVYVGKVLFAYDDGCYICIPPETTKVLNELEMRMKIESTVADLRIIYESYVLRKDFDDLQSNMQKEIQQLNTTIQDMKRNAVVQVDCTDQVQWGEECSKEEFLIVGNLAMFRTEYTASKGYSTKIAQIPVKYCKSGSQNHMVGIFNSAADKGTKMCEVTINGLNGNVDVSSQDIESKSYVAATAGITIIGIWKIPSAMVSNILQASSTMMDILNVPQMHKNMYRGKYLGDKVTDEMLTNIRNGTFQDLFVGDYWIIDGVNYRIADIDYWYDIGNAEKCTTHHLVIVPDTIIGTAKMNNSATVNGGYINSVMKKQTLNTVASNLPETFRSRLMTHSSYISDYWMQTSVDLLSEVMLYGCKILSLETRLSDTQQLRLFALNPEKIPLSSHYWLRDTVSASNFAVMNLKGFADSASANGSFGIRPVFAIA